MEAPSFRTAASDIPLIAYFASPKTGASRSSMTLE